MFFFHGNSYSGSVAFTEFCMKPKWILGRLHLEFSLFYFLYTENVFTIMRTKSVIRADRDWIAQAKFSSHFLLRVDSADTWLADFRWHLSVNTSPNIAEIHFTTSTYQLNRMSNIVWFVQIFHCYREEKLSYLFSFPTSKIRYRPFYRPPCNVIFVQRTIKFPFEFNDNMSGINEILRERFVSCIQHRRIHINAIQLS